MNSQNRFPLPLLSLFVVVVALANISNTVKAVSDADILSHGKSCTDRNRFFCFENHHCCNKLEEQCGQDNCVPYPATQAANLSLCCEKEVLNVTERQDCARLLLSQNRSIRSLCASADECTPAPTSTTPRSSTETLKTPADTEKKEIEQDPKVSSGQHITCNCQSNDTNYTAVVMTGIAGLVIGLGVRPFLSWCCQRKSRVYDRGGGRTDQKGIQVLDNNANETNPARGGGANTSTSGANGGENGDKGEDKQIPGRNQESEQDNSGLGRRISERPLSGDGGTTGGNGHGEGEQTSTPGANGGEIGDRGEDLQIPDPSGKNPESEQDNSGAVTEPLLPSTGARTE